jgi:hypothetical protein
VRQGSASARSSSWSAGLPREPAKGLCPLISPQSPSAGCQYLLPRSARLGPLCGSQREQNSRYEPHSGPIHHVPHVSPLPVDE